MVFPLFLVLVARFRRQRVVMPAIGLVTLASFLLGLVLLPRWPEATFHLLPTRVWGSGSGR